MQIYVFLGHLAWNLLRIPCLVSRTVTLHPNYISWNICVVIIQSVLIKTCRQDKYKLVDWRIIGSHGRCRGKLSFNYHSWGTGMILLGPLSHLGMMIRLIGLAARMIGLAADWSAWQHDGKERLFPMMVEIVTVSSDGEDNIIFVLKRLVLFLIFLSHQLFISIEEDGWMKLIIERNYEDCGTRTFYDGEAVVFKKCALYQTTFSKCVSKKSTFSILIGTIVVKLVRGLKIVQPWSTLCTWLDCHFWS